MVRGLDGFDPYAEWLDVPVDRRPPDYYELLGLAPGDSDAARIRAASVERTARVRRYCLGPHGADATRLLGELGAAFACLSDPERRAAYDRQLEGAVGDVSGYVAPPPILRHVEMSDEEAPPRRFTAGESKTPAVGRSASWPRRRREVLSSGPARFTFASVFVLAITCGAVWFARRPPAEAELVGTYVPESPQPLVPVATSAEVKPPADEQKKLAPPEAPTEAEKSSQSPPTDRTDSTQGRDDSPADDKATAAVLPKSDVPSDRPASEFDEEFETRPGGWSYHYSWSGRSMPGFPPPPANKPGVPIAGSALPDNAQSGEPTSGMPDGVAEQDVAEQDRGARILPPLPSGGQSTWTLSTGDEPESLELTFDDPVDAAHIELVEPTGPAMIDRAAITAVDGSTIEIKPIDVYFHDGIRRWSLGTKRRAPTNRLMIRFRPTEQGVIELSGVAVLDRSGQPQFPTLVRAVTKPANAAKPPAGATQNRAATSGDAEADSPDDTRTQVAANTPGSSGDDEAHDAKGADSVDAIEELARQELTKAREDPSRSIDRYVKLLGDKDYVKTQAAVEAVRDLKEIIDTRRGTGAVSSARRALKGLVTHYPDSDAAKAASGADRPERGRPK